MRRHASAAPAASTQRQSADLGGFDRGASTTLAHFHRVDGSGAPAHLRRSLAVIPVLVAILALAFVPTASAGTQRPFKETFGSAEQPTFEYVDSIATDQQTGDVFVAWEEIGGQEREGIDRFNADGTPAPFAALGTNEIDGMEANGKPCAEEPASCDKTPQDAGVQVSQSQIAIDESGGSTDGDIYLAERVAKRVTIFGPDGRYLGQLTEAGVRNFHAVGGVAVGPDGSVYVSNETVISKFVPNANPVVNTDLAASLGPVTGTLGNQIQFQRLAIGKGAAADSLFSNYTDLERYVIPGGGEGQRGVEFQVQLERATGVSQAIFGEVKYGAAGYGSGNLAVDPTSGNVLIGNGAEYEVSGVAQPQQVGRLVPTNNEELKAFAVDSSGEALVTTRAFSPISIYGAPAVVPAVTADPASEIGGTTATLSGTVNPSGPEVTGCVFQYGEVGPSGGANFGEHEVDCDEGDWEGATDAIPHQVHVAVAGLEANGHTYGFRLVAFNKNGSEEAQGQTFTTAHTVVTEPATAIGQDSATLNGLVRPEGEPYTACFFEYGLSSSRSFEKTVPCTPGALAIPADFTPNEVRAQIAGLQSGATYRYRLVATNAGLGTLRGEEQTLSTFGLPRIVEAQASTADHTSVILEARINPSGFDTSYRFEWGPTTAYGNVAPLEFAPFIGSGTEPILVQAKISGLAAGSIYHYRVSASNNRGTVQSPDQVAETLNSCGLFEGRCFELVSRSEAGPVAIPGEGNAHIEMHYQAATEGAGGLAYEVESGYPEATKGAEVLYRSSRGSSGWESAQLSTPITAQNEQISGGSYSDGIEFLSNELTCGFVESTQPLTPDPSMRLVREQGGSNLYRINPDGSYTPVTTLPPKNAEGTSALNNYTMAGASEDCGMAAFESRYVYPGIDASELYEWRGGSLRNAGLVPGSNGEVVVKATAGGGSRIGIHDRENAVSEDGSRLFFTALRQTSSDPAEIGKEAVFVREDGRETRDVSLSETGVPDEGALYQWATADGSKVFFTANAGLTEDSNSEGTDLYEYDLETEELTDRTVTEAEGGAEVNGFLGASADGSRVYFSSRNQLIPGRGNSRAQNLAANTYSIYGERAGQISFVGTYNSIERTHVLIENSAGWNSQVSPDGRYLLFETAARVTGYESAGLSEAYLYDADSGQTICVSCRQDGQPSTDGRYGEPNYSLLARNEAIWNPMHGPRFLTERNGEAQVFFSSPDPLAPGAIAGQNNVYEWSHNQIFRLISAPEGSEAKPYPGVIAAYAGGSEDGSDVYLVTPETLTWQDGDERLSVYDARIEGGFTRPPASPAQCQPTLETSCQGNGQSAAAVPGATTEGFSGPGNPKAQPKKPKPKKHQKKKPKHKKKHPKKKHNKKKKRQANGNGRNGK